MAAGTRTCTLRERMVGSTRSGLAASSRKVTTGGGSSRALRSAEAASLVRGGVWQEVSTKTRRFPSYGCWSSRPTSSRAWSMEMSLFPGSGPMSSTSGWMPRRTRSQASQVQPAGGPPWQARPAASSRARASRPKPGLSDQHQRARQLVRGCECQAAVEQPGHGRPGSRRSSIQLGQGSCEVKGGCP